MVERVSQISDEPLLPLLPSQTERIVPEDTLLDSLIITEESLPYLLDDGGVDALERVARSHFATYAHLIRTGALACAIGARAGLSPERCQAFMAGAFLHDLGKVADKEILELLDAGAFTNDQQRHTMARHTSVGGELLDDLADQSLEASDPSRYFLYRFAGGMAYTHHEYNHDILRERLSKRVGQGELEWSVAAGQALQLLDVVDAVTARAGDRRYRKARMEQEGVTPYTAVEGMLNRDYGVRQDDPLPVFGFSPRQIANTAFYAAQTFHERAEEGRMRTLAIGGSACDREVVAERLPELVLPGARVA